MGVVVAVAADGGVALASDTLAVGGDGGVTSENAQQLYEFDDAVVGAIGDRGDVDAFARRVRGELQQLDVEPGRHTDAAAVSRIVAEAAADGDVEALVAARDGGDVTAQQVDSDGGVVSVETGAVGSGAALALGYLESADAPDDLAAATALARESVDAARDVDPESGGDVDVATLADDE